MNLSALAAFIFRSQSSKKHNDTSSRLELEIIKSQMIADERLEREELEKYDFQLCSLKKENQLHLRNYSTINAKVYRFVEAVESKEWDGKNYMDLVKIIKSFVEDYENHFFDE
jgi:hypothetical protein